MSRLRRLLVAVAEDLGLRRRPVPVVVDLRVAPVPVEVPVEEPPAVASEPERTHADDLHEFIAYLLAEKAAATASLV